MIIRASVETAKSLRATFKGNFKIPAFYQLRSSAKTTAEDPVHLIAGTPDIQLKFDGLPGKYDVKLVAQFHKTRDLSANILPVGGNALLRNTELLCGLYAVIVNNLDRPEKEAQWFVRFVNIAVPPLEAEHGASKCWVYKDPIDKSPYVGIHANMTLIAMGILSSATTHPLDNVYIAFIQNLQPDKRLYAHYEWISPRPTLEAEGKSETAGTASIRDHPSDPRGTMFEGTPEVAGPWVDSDQQEWSDLETVKEGRGESSFPFTGNVTSEDSRLRIIEMDDSPGAAFPVFVDAMKHPLPDTATGEGGYYVIRKILGTNLFTSGIAASTKDAPFTILVYRLARWRLTSNLHLKLTRPAEYPAMYDQTIVESGRVGTEYIEAVNYSLPWLTHRAGIEIYGPPAAPDDENPEDRLLISDREWRPGWFIG